MSEPIPIVELQVTVDLTLKNRVGMQFRSAALTPATMGYTVFSQVHAATVALHAGSDLLKTVLPAGFVGGWYMQDDVDFLVENQVVQAKVTVAHRLTNGHTQEATLGVEIPVYEDTDGLHRGLGLVAGCLRRITDSLAGGRYIQSDDE
jgi:hypothetical protein